jgi:hypothetical protein
LRWWDIVKDKINSAFAAFVHDTVALLIIDFIDFAYLKTMGATIDHETNPGIGCDGNMNTMSMVKGRVPVVMRFDDSSRLKSGCHGSNDGTARRIMVGQNLVHQR